MMSPPLANALLKQLTLPLRKRSLDENCRPEKLCGAQFFEVSEIRALAQGISDSFFPHIYDEEDACEAPYKANASYPQEVFLPSKTTWLEFVNSEGCRVGILLNQRTRIYVGATVFLKASCGTFFCVPELVADYSRLHNGYILSEGAREVADDRAASDDPFDFRPFVSALKIEAPAFLIAINSPKWTRQSFSVGTGKAARYLTQGRWPYMGWRTVTKNVDKTERTRVAALEETGRRALHHVNAHLRWIESKRDWTRVREHWRGDASLGQISTRHVAARDPDPRKRLSSASFPRTEKMRRAPG